MAKPRHHKRKLRTGRVAVVTIAVTVAALCAVVAYNALSTCATPCRIYIPRASTAEAVKDTLCSNLGEGYGAAVYRLWRWQGGEAQVAVGSYEVTASESALRLSRRLKTGRQTPLRFTFNNVRTIGELADIVDRKLMCGKADFIAACDSLLPAAGFSSREQYPAAFVPGTYELYWTASASTVVSKLLAARNAFWNDERRAQASSMGLTPVQVVTIASIVEEETACSDEYGTIGRLYINRVRRGMKLQADPTVKYAVGDFGLRRITGAHLRVQSPYNTYQVAGLPPGPIRIASPRSINAVLTAAEHSYLYMCAKEDFSGRHNFASDYATHCRNAAAYQRALDHRGIK